MTAAETEQVEYKRSLGEWKEIVETVAAFATASGGCIRIGVDPSGARVGVQVGRGTLEDLANKIKVNTEPPQFPSIRSEGSDDAAVIDVEVQESPIKPVWAFGRPFQRVGRTNQRLSREEAHRLWQWTSGQSWDALPCPGLRIDDLDQSLVEFFLRGAGQPEETPTEAVLEKQRLIAGDGLAHAAALLFARDPLRWVWSARVQCGRFVGTDSVRFLDEQAFEESVLTVPEKVLAFVARNTRQAIRITGRPEHERVPEYPVEAVREAVINAVCHRDYASSSNVQVRIHDDRLEVWNPGHLPHDLPLEALYQRHASHPWNRRLAEALYRARLIEQWGTGTLRIVEVCLEAGLPRPEFITEMGMFIVRFRPEVPDSGEPFDARLDLLRQRLNDRQRGALAYVQAHGEITRGKYRELFGISERQSLRDLDGLLDLGLLVRLGASVATYYSLPNRGDGR